MRIETGAEELEKTNHRSLAEKLEQEGSEDGQAVQLPAALRAMLGRLEGELRRNAVSEESRAWLAGGWNLYQYPLDPVQFADPLGLRGIGSFGDGFNHYCQQAGSAVTYLPSEEAMVTIHNMETMHNVYNPLSEYVFGLSAGSAIAGMGGMSFGAAAVAEKGSACIKDVAESMIKDGERDPKNLALTCGKSFINEGSSSFQGKISDYLIDTLFSYKAKQ